MNIYEHLWTVCVLSIEKWLGSLEEVTVCPGTTLWFSLIHGLIWRIGGSWQNTSVRSVVRQWDMLNKSTANGSDQIERWMKWRKWRKFEIQTWSFPKFFESLQTSETRNFPPPLWIGTAGCTGMPCTGCTGIWCAIGHMEGMNASAAADIGAIGAIDIVLGTCERKRRKCQVHLVKGRFLLRLYCILLHLLIIQSCLLSERREWHLTWAKVMSDIEWLKM